MKGEDEDKDGNVERRRRIRTGRTEWANKTGETGWGEQDRANRTG